METVKKVRLDLTDNGFNYVIIKENYPDIERVSTLLDSKYLKSKRYAMIFKQTYKDGSENVTHIKYSNDLEELQNVANEFPSWYNYPLGISKSLQGYISELP